MNTVNPIFICNYFNSRFTWDWKNNSLLRVLERGIPPRGQDAWFRTKRISHCCLTLVKPISHRCSMIMRDKQFKYFYQVYSFSYKEHAIFILATNFRNFHRTRTLIAAKNIYDDMDVKNISKKFHANKCWFTANVIKLLEFIVFIKKNLYYCSK